MNDTSTETPEMLENVAAILDAEELPSDPDDGEEEDED